MGFEACHPAVNLVYFVAVIYGSLSFSHPAYVAVSFVCGFLYSLKQNRRALLFDLCLIPAAGLFALYYGCFHHFGMTVLTQNFIGNNLTLESLLYGLFLGARVAAALMWLGCLYSVFSADKAVYLFGRISPRLSLFAAIILRMVPRIKVEAKRINTARKSLGRGVDQGSFLRRTQNGLAIFSMLISWCIGALATASASMESRGSRLWGRKAFSIYRFDGRDRLYVLALSFFMTLTAMAMILGHTQMIYSPRILYTPMTLVEVSLCLGYACLCLLAPALDLWTHLRFSAAVSARYSSKSESLIAN